MGISRIRGPADAGACRPTERQRAARPIALVSTPASSTVPWIDVEGLAAEFGPLVDVYVISTGPDTWSLTNALPTGTQVYGGAGRVYPLGHEWTSDLSRSPLRFAVRQPHRTTGDPRTGLRRTRNGSRSRLAESAAGATPDSRDRSGQGSADTDRAIVEMPNRLLATIAQELTIPEVPLDRMLVKGMQVHGLLDAAQRRFDIREAIRPKEAVSYEVGQPVLAVVTEADAARRARSSQTFLRSGSWTDRHRRRTFECTTERSLGEAGVRRPSHVQVYADEEASLASSVGYPSGRQMSAS